MEGSDISPQRILVRGDGPFEEQLSQASDILRADGIALLPAEGLYGLHARSSAEGARRRIIELKGGSQRRPFILLIGDPEDSPALVASLPGAARELISAAWPGPLTLILPASPSIPIELQSDGTVALRCPGDRFLRELAHAIAGPIISTSANLSGESPPASLDEVAPQVLAACDLVADGGELAGIGSTIIRPEADGALTLLREGLWDPGKWAALLRKPAE